MLTNTHSWNQLPLNEKMRRWKGVWIECNVKSMNTENRSLNNCGYCFCAIQHQKNYSSNSVSRFIISNSNIILNRFWTKECYFWLQKIATENSSINKGVKQCITSWIIVLLDKDFVNMRNKNAFKFSTFFKNACFVEQKVSHNSFFLMNLDILRIWAIINPFEV